VDDFTRLYARGMFWLSTIVVVGSLVLLGKQVITGSGSTIKPEYVATTVFGAALAVIQAVSKHHCQYNVRLAAALTNSGTVEQIPPCDARLLSSQTAIAAAVDCCEHAHAPRTTA
jgi:hypothetical protein